MNKLRDIDLEDDIYINFVNSLELEIESIKKNVSEKSFELTNGVLEDVVGNQYLYSFYINQNTGFLKEDSPIRLRIGSDIADGVIVSNIEKKLIIAVDEDLGKIIGTVNLEIDLSFITLKLKEAWEKIIEDRGQNASKYNIETSDQVLGLKEIIIDDNNAKKISIDDLNKEQNQALDLSIRSNVSFIWGPPGTGKTYTLARLIEFYYLKGNRILLLSNTNMAVDMLLKSLSTRLIKINNEDYKNGSVLRFQNIIDKDLKNQFGEYIQLDNIVDRLGKELKEIKQKIENEISNIKPTILSLKKIIKELNDYSNLKEYKTLYHELNDLIQSGLKNQGIIRSFFSGKRTKNAIVYDIAKYERKLKDSKIKIEGNIQNGENENETFILDLISSYEVKLDPYNKVSVEDELGNLSEKLRINENKLSKINEEISELSLKIMNNAKVIAATTTQTFLQPKNFNDFDVVVLDEASMINLPSVSYVSTLTKNKVIISGDFMQIPAISQISDKQENAKKTICTNVFKKIGIEKSVFNNQSHKNMVQLRTQYRMDEKICDLINDRFYQGSLIQGTGAGRMENKTYPNFLNSPLIIIDTADDNPWASLKPNTFSRYNIINAITIRNLCFHLHQEGFVKNINDIGVVTPYKAQSELLTKVCEEMMMENIDCATVHKFQGSEKDVIIFDIPDSTGQSWIGRNIKGDNLSDESTKLINVAISRARSHIILVGNMDYLHRNLSDNSYLRQIIFEMQEKGDYKSSKEIISLGPTNKVVSVSDFINDGFDYNPEKTNFYDEATFDKAFLADMENAKKFIIIFSAFATSRRIAFWADTFRQKIKEGVKIKCITRESSKQPGKTDDIRKTMQDLKDIGVSIDFRHEVHEKNIMIDGEILWHGSLNALSHTGKTEEEMLRIVSKEISLQKAKFEIFRRTGIKDNPSPYDMLLNSENPTCPSCGGMTVIHKKSKFYPFTAWFSCDSCDFKGDDYKISRSSSSKSFSNKTRNRKKMGAPIDQPSEIINCPSDGCNGNLVVRARRRDGNKFFGCSKWPKCEYTENFH